MTNISEAFDDAYAKWKAVARSERTAISSSDADHVRNPEFDAIIALGEPAIPYIVEKMRTDDYGHFLIHALDRITGKRFTPEEIADAERRHGSPLGNQGYAELWQEWWRRYGGSND